MPITQLNDALSRPDLDTEALMTALMPGPISQAIVVMRVIDLLQLLYADDWYGKAFDFARARLVRDLAAYRNSQAFHARTDV